jgi:hypothetical protein
MTEMANGLGQNIENVSAQNVSSTPNNTQDASQAAMDERVFKQSEVNEIVKRAKNDAVETYRRISTEQPQYAQQKYGEQPSQSQHQSSNSFNEDHYRKIAAEEAKRHLESVRQDALRQNQDELAKRTVQNFFAKTSKGREKYQDFDQVTGDVDLGRFPNVVQLLGEFIENSDDVFYELGKDRIKMANLEHLATISPNDAIVQAKRLSQSIKDNNQALQSKQARAPLSPIKPTNYGTDGDVLSVSDFRKKYRNMR